MVGAAGGIGRATAIEFARAGAAVALIDLDRDRCAEVVRDIHLLEGRCIAIGADIGNESDVIRAAGDSERELGACGVLVNTPAVSGRPDALDGITLEKWLRQFTVNVTGYTLCAQAFGRQMQARGGGSMVHVGSIAGQFPQPNSGAYSITKAAIAMMSRVLALELAGRGIRSNVVSPAMVRTPLSEKFYGDPTLLERRRNFVPLHDIATPRQIADAILFLASPRASYITGQDLLIDGGVSLALMGLFPR
ncbi:MAG: SDR family NAD(P)-dependent oxidoreductase [Lautropia sp.]